MTREKQFVEFIEFVGFVEFVEFAGIAALSICLARNDKGVGGWQGQMAESGLSSQEAAFGMQGNQELTADVQNRVSEIWRPTATRGKLRAAIRRYMCQLPFVHMASRRYPEHQRGFGKLCKENPVLADPDSIDVVLTLDRLQIQLQALR
jgi:hypothetical protein